MITCYKANSIGRNAKQIIDILKEDYKDNMSFNDGLNLIAKCFKENIDKADENTQFFIIQ